MQSTLRCTMLQVMPLAVVSASQGFVVWRQYAGAGCNDEDLMASADLPMDVCTGPLKRPYSGVFETVTANTTHFNVKIYNESQIAAVR